MDRYTGRSFEDLVVYQQALQLVMAIYGLVSQFPKSNPPNLVNLVKNAAVSITTNIAEGSKKPTASEKIRVFGIARNAIEDCRVYLNMVSEHGLADTTGLISQLRRVEMLLEEHMAMI